MSSIQYFIAIQCYMKSLFSLSISCKEGVACGVQFCMKSLFCRQSDVGRVCLAFNTLSQYSAI